MKVLLHSNMSPNLYRNKKYMVYLEIRIKVLQSILYVVYGGFL